MTENAKVNKQNLPFIHKLKAYVYFSTLKMYVLGGRDEFGAEMVALITNAAVWC